jgi:NAD(P)-dependent dehydrogenase (short-subunit alcohol dehydrogenase family)
LGGRLQDRTAFNAGAGSAVERAHALLFATKGPRLVLADRGVAE